MNKIYVYYNERNINNKSIWKCDTWA